MLYSPNAASLGFSQVRTNKRMLTSSQLLFPGRWAGHSEADTSVRKYLDVQFPSPKFQILHQCFSKDGAKITSKITKFSSVQSLSHV